MKYLQKSVQIIVVKINNSHPLIWLGLFSIYFIVLSWLTRDYLGFSGDMAEYTNNPVRILNGQYPYVDFFLLFTPGEILIPSAIYKLFGVNTDTLRFVSIIISWLSAVIVFYLSKAYFKANTRAIVFTLIYTYSSVIFFYCGPDYIHLYFFSVLLAFTFLINYILREKYIYVFLSGILIGAGIFFRLYEVLAAGFGLWIALTIYMILNKNRLSNIMKSSLLYLMGILIMIAIYSLVFSSYLDKMIQQVVYLSLQNGTAMSLPYFSNLQNYINELGADFSALFGYFSIKAIIGILFHFIKTIVASTYYLLPVTITIVLIWILKQKIEIKNKGIALLLFGWAAFSFLKASSRSDLAHLAPFLAPAFMFLFFVFISENNSIKNNKFIKYIIFTSLLIGLSSAISPVTRFAQIYSNDTYIYKSDRGSIIFTTKKEYDDNYQLIKFIQANTKANDYIFATDWFLPPVHALTGRMNPTYYDSMNDLVISPSIENQTSIINDLKKHKNTLVINNPNWGYDNKPEQQFSVACRILQDYFDSHYDKIAVFGNQEVLKFNKDK